MTTSYLLCVASLLAAGVAFAHSYLGEKYVLSRLFRRELPKLFGDDIFTKQTLRFAWHLTSVAWVGLGGILLGNPARGSVLLIGGTFLVSGFFPLIATRGKHLAWIVFFAIAGLCFLDALCVVQ